MKNCKSTRIFGLRQLIALFGFAAFFFFAANGLTQEQAPPLLVMISVDGMRPDYITGADAHGAKVPNLRRFLKQGPTPKQWWESCPPLPIRAIRRWLPALPSADGKILLP